MTGACPSPDTFWLTPPELKDGGCRTADIHQARKAFEEELCWAAEEACEGLSSEEESEEDEDAGEEGQGEGLAGEGQAAGEGQVDAEAEPAEGGEQLVQPVLLVPYS